MQDNDLDSLGAPTPMRDAGDDDDGFNDGPAQIEEEEEDEGYDSDLAAEINKGLEVRLSLRVRSCSCARADATLTIFLHTFPCASIHTSSTYARKKKMPRTRLSMRPRTKNRAARQR